MTGLLFEASKTCMHVRKTFSFKIITVKCLIVTVVQPRWDLKTCQEMVDCHSQSSGIIYLNYVLK